MTIKTAEFGKMKMSQEAARFLVKTLEKAAQWYEDDLCVLGEEDPLYREWVETVYRLDLLINNIGSSCRK